MNTVLHAIIANNARLRCQPAAKLCGVLICALLATAGVGHAEDVTFRIADSVPVKGKDLPYTLLLSLEETAPTRLGAAASLDLRSFQKNAPWILSNVLQETCKRKFALAVSDVRADGDALVAEGQVQAKFFACDTRDPKTHYRGVLLFGQNVDVLIRASADVSGNCLNLQLEDVHLDLQGFIGTVSDAIGLTDRARELILEKGAEVLAENPVCPSLPDELAGLEPSFTSGGVREIGAGGVGAALKGSVDTSAETLLDLIAVMQEKQGLGVVE